MRLPRSLASLLVLIVLTGCSGAAETAQRPQPPTTAMGPVGQTSLLAMGDWGEDTAAQRQVAVGMARYARTDDVRGGFKAVLLCGDNFYFKLTGVNDPRWRTLFEQMYSPAALNVPFYACLGNHDYDGDNMRIEISYASEHPDSRFKLPDRWYRVDLPEDQPMATVIMLDSNKDNLTDRQWDQQIAWLKNQLEGPRAPWTICCAHHPLFSNGFFWGNGILQNDWGTLFKKYKVDFYLCGHEHNLEHLEIPGWFPSFVVAGGGGAHSHPLARDDRGFSRAAFGFVDFELAADRAIVRYIGTDDKPLHVFERTKAGKVKVLQTTPNTPRTNPLKAYLQIRQPKAAATQP